MSAVQVVTAPDAVFDGRMRWHDNEQTLIMSLLDHAMALRR